MNKKLIVRSRQPAFIILYLLLSIFRNYQQLVAHVQFKAAIGYHKFIASLYQHYECSSRQVHVGKPIASKQIFGREGHIPQLSVYLLGDFHSKFIAFALQRQV